MWFDGNRILTYNTLFNFVVGNRGTGKTYWFKKWAVADFLRTGAQFIYLRRYRTECDVKSFFTQIKPEFPNVKFSVKGQSFFINEKFAGQCIALSQGITKKSMPFDGVNKLCFDEFMLEEAHYRYLKNEVNAFLDFYETVNRLRIDGRRDCTVFFLSNALSLYNPYFTFFEIKFGKSNRFRKGDLYAEIFQDPEFTKVKKLSRFGQLIEGTEYADYAIDNTFYLDDSKLVSKREGNCGYYATFVIEGVDYGIWINYEVGRMWISKEIDPSCLKRFCFSGKDHGLNTMLIKGHSMIIKGFVTNYKLGNVYYDSMEVKAKTSDTINKIIF